MRRICVGEYSPPLRAVAAIMSSPTRCSKRSLPKSMTKNSALSMKSTSRPSVPCLSYRSLSSGFPRTCMHQRVCAIAAAGLTLPEGGELLGV